MVLQFQVRPGIYNEALTYAESPKSFTLRALSGASETIIDASGLGRAAVFIRDITGTVDIEGFTITGGQNPTGSGNFFQRASVNLKDCVIEGNYGYQGGGLQLFDANSTIENSTFRDNVASKAAGGIAINPNDNSWHRGQTGILSYLDYMQLLFTLNRIHTDHEGIVISYEDLFFGDSAKQHSIIDQVFEFVGVQLKDF